MMNPKQENPGWDAPARISDRFATGVTVLGRCAKCGLLSPSMLPPNALRPVVLITLSSSLLGALFAYAENRPHGIADFVNTELRGMLAGGLNGGILSSLEILVLRGAYGASLRQLPFLPYLALRSHRRDQQVAEINPTGTKPLLLGYPRLSAVLRRCAPSPHTSGASSRPRRRRGSRRGGGPRSLLGDPGLAQAVENGLKLGQIRRVVAHRRPSSAGAGDGEGRVEREAGLDGGTRLVKSTELRRPKHALVGAERECREGQSSGPRRCPHFGQRFKLGVTGSS